MFVGPNGERRTPMRAAVVREHGSLDNILLEDDFPEPALQPDWVRVAVRACSINYHDIFSRRGMPGIRLPLPLVIGSDIAGEVVALFTVRLVRIIDRQREFVSEDFGRFVERNAVLPRVPLCLPAIQFEFHGTGSTQRNRTLPSRRNGPTFNGIFRTRISDRSFDGCGHCCGVQLLPSTVRADPSVRALSHRRRS